VPTDILWAIIFPGLLQPQGAFDLSPTNVLLVTGDIALVVAWHTNSVLRTVVIGMSTRCTMSAIAQATVYP
jgi:branched-subunit amino acid transport protein